MPTQESNPTNRRKLLYRCNHLLRSRGLSPAAVGGSGVRDSVKLATFNVARVGKHLLNRARGRPVEDLRAAYAPAF